MLKKIPNYFMRILSRLVLRLIDKPLTAPTPYEMELVNDLRKSFLNLPVFDTINLPPSQAFWFDNLNRLRRLVIDNDPREFLRWDVVRSTMFVTHPMYIVRELMYLRRQVDWRKRWRPALNESPIGHPTPYLFIPTSSGNLIHHAYHVAQFERCNGKTVDTQPFVFEFGGGYGSLCRLIHSLGFSGKYILFDLPHFSLLQQFFLRSLKIPVQSFEEALSASSGVCCISDLGQLKTLLSNSAYDDFNKSFIATWSISETPLHIRDPILELVKNFSSFLVAYQSKFNEVDNTVFFREWTASATNQIAWVNWRIKHMPGENYYLVGIKVPG